MERNPRLALRIGGLLLLAAAPAAAQWVNPDTCSWANASCQQANKEKDERSKSDAAFRNEMAESEARRARVEEERRRALLKTQPLPTERNALLGSWRLDAGERSNVGGPGRETARNKAVSDLMNTFSIAGLERLGCATWFGGGVSFTPSTYARHGMGSVLDGGGTAAGGVAYRAEQRDAKQVTVAIPNDARQSMLSFEVTGAGRIVSTAGCVLVRGDAPANHAAANTTAAPGNARIATASPSVPPPSTLARPSPEVCRNTLIDKLGTVGSNQVRAMSDVRFMEAAIEGKVPNTNHLRIDLRGSACDDPRIKATLYDFDANEMLRSVTYVWDRPPGPAPAPIFQERVAQLSRFHSLPPPQTPGRLQADTALGRLIVQDMPERNLLLEAYSAPK